ncbi:hypothetical protein AAFF_G00292130 [Aldrovandia affinis]|uniref:Uncharacterized protein n=1 Tax=Aldrovandia affinis TaxID=143900 RepID=A0AAD7SQF1_9TELE|nr:hypothetical protein AAFF_G00292130 [Aldrovandia affinis]
MQGRAAAATAGWASAGLLQTGQLAKQSNTRFRTTDSRRCQNLSPLTCLQLSIITAVQPVLISKGYKKPQHAIDVERETLREHNRCRVSSFPLKCLPFIQADSSDHQTCWHLQFRLTAVFSQPPDSVPPI